MKLSELPFCDLASSQGYHLQKLNTEHPVIHTSCVGILKINNLIKVS